MLPLLFWAPKVQRTPLRAKSKAEINGNVLKFLEPDDKDITNDYMFEYQGTEEHEKVPYIQDDRSVVGPEAMIRKDET